MDKERKEITIISHYKLSIKDTIIANMPFMLSIGIWLIILAKGLAYIQTEFSNNGMYPVLVLTYLMIVFNLNRIVVSPKTTWNVDRVTEEE